MVKRRYPYSLFRKVVVPVLPRCDPMPALSMAESMAKEGSVLLVGIVPVPQGVSLSKATDDARGLRETLSKLCHNKHIRCSDMVRVSHAPWEELLDFLQAEEPDLLVLDWPRHFDALGVNLEDTLQNLPYNIAVTRVQSLEIPQRILLALRGGPFAEMALRLSLAISRNTRSELTVLHIPNDPDSTSQDLPFRGFDRVLRNMPEVHRIDVLSDDPGRVILDESHDYDLVVVGASAGSEDRSVSLGMIADRVLRSGASSVIVVKTRQVAAEGVFSESSGRKAISVLVDKWFAENTYKANEFKDLNALLELKREQDTSIALALPALNEEETVGEVIQTLKMALMDDVPLLDEMILVDSDSTDRTRNIAESLGVRVAIHQQVLPEYGARRGKGEALWKSLFLTNSDIILWIDTDITNIRPHFVYGLIGPLLHRPDVQFVKGFYRRPLRVGDKVQAGGGGRVTELTARPLINLFYPELSGIIQPLSGEYGGRRSALEQLPFFSGYGVEIGLLIDLFEHFGLGAIAQVDLHQRIHRNQSLEALSMMSFAIIQAITLKLENRLESNIMEEVNKTMKLIRYEPGRLFLDVEEIAELERPPMIDLPEYRQRQEIWSGYS